MDALDLNGSGMLARAAVLADLFATRALETEQLGRLPDANLELLLELGITRVAMPREWGGLELGFAAAVDVVAAIAGGCMSSAWCAALYAEHPWILSHFSHEAQADVWGAGPDVAVAMSIAAVGEGRPAENGIDLSGTWPFVSGCDHAQWIMLAAKWTQATQDGSIEDSGLCLVPASDVHIDHTSWRVAGLRGTGSKTVQLDGVRVPRSRLCSSRALFSPHTLAAASASALFRQPFQATLGLTLAAVPLGGAEGAYAYFRQRATQRVLRNQGRVQAADPAAQIELSEARLRTQAARLLLHTSCERVCEAGEHSTELSPLDLAEFGVRKAYVARLCAEAVDGIFAASGGNALHETNPLQRFWRDVHATHAHTGMNWSSHAQNYGSLAVGLGPTLQRPW